MDKINELKIRIENIFNEELTMDKLNELKVEYLGKKGYITELNSMIKELPNEEKKEFGKNVNELRNLFDTKYEEVKIRLEEELLNKKLESERIDITLPSKKVRRGSLHPMSRIQAEFEDIFVSSRRFLPQKASEIADDLPKSTLIIHAFCREVKRNVCLTAFFLTDGYKNIIMKGNILRHAWHGEERRTPL